MLRRSEFSLLSELAAFDDDPALFDLTAQERVRHRVRRAKVSEAAAHAAEKEASNALPA